MTELLKPKQYAPASNPSRSSLWFCSRQERGYLADVELAKSVASKPQHSSTVITLADARINQSGGYSDEIEGKLKGISIPSKATQSRR
ncbi:hypothetical protein KCP73_12295 [Salmonella enterica subsp. enterica]|nr:hypothetical protein KCP73_12295 [Salmonella enterica subsp. enterica]